MNIEDLQLKQIIGNVKITKTEYKAKVKEPEPKPETPLKNMDITSIKKLYADNQKMISELNQNLSNRGDRVHNKLEGNPQQERVFINSHPNFFVISLGHCITKIWNMCD